MLGCEFGSEAPSAEELSDHFPDLASLHQWLDNEVDLLADECWRTLLDRWEVARISCYGPGIELYRVLGEEQAEALGLVLVDGDAPGRDFLGVRVVGDLDRLNRWLADH